MVDCFANIAIHEVVYQNADKKAKGNNMLTCCLPRQHTLRLHTRTTTITLVTLNLECMMQTVISTFSNLNISSNCKFNVEIVRRTAGTMTMYLLVCNNWNSWK